MDSRSRNLVRYVAVMVINLVNSTATPVVADETTSPPTTGTLQGRFVYVGTPAPRLDTTPWLTRMDTTSQISRDSFGRASGAEMGYREYLNNGIYPDTRDASLLIGPDGGIANVIVWAISPDIPWVPQPDADKQTRTIRFEQGNFSPRVTVCTKGQTILFENNDLVSFNAHAFPNRNDPVNLLIKPRDLGPAPPWQVRSAEKLPFCYQSDLQVWTKGWVFVHSNPYAAVSGADGRFQIANLPPGEWEFVAWHERCGYVTYWPQGRFEWQIRPGLNDMGKIPLQPEEPKDLTPASSWNSGGDNIHRSLPKDDSANNSRGAVPETPSQDPTSVAPPSIRKWHFVLIDGSNQKVLPGVTVQFSTTVQGLDRPQRITMTSDERGRLEVHLATKGQTTAQVATPGWWTANGAFPDREHAADEAGEPQSGDRTPVNSMDKPTQVKLWKGLIVTGTLLDPFGTPLPGVGLNVSVHIRHAGWKERLGMPLNTVSFDRDLRANWTSSILTEADGTFKTTVPPHVARTSIRVGTAGIGPHALSTEGLDPNGPGRALLQFAPFEAEFEAFGGADIPIINHVLNVGSLKLQRGRILAGKVLNVDGQPLTGAVVYVSNRYGLTAGRQTTTDQQGRFEFLPLNAGACTVTVDARIRNSKGELQSRDVHAVLLPKEVTLSEKYGRHEITIQACRHYTLEFEWIDRRKQKGRVGFDGTLTVQGHIGNGTTASGCWQGETEKIVRDRRELWTIKVPASLLKARLLLPADDVVTTSYEDPQTKSGPGSVELKDLATPQRRVIYADEPHL